MLSKASSLGFYGLINFSSEFMSGESILPGFVLNLDAIRCI
jgi:hypothetical protein